MVTILIITLVSFLAFLLLTGCGIMRDFSSLWLKHSTIVFRAKQGIGYYSELAVTFTIVLVISIAAAILKGASTTLVAMATTSDIAQFTTALRGTFSSYTTELQSPRNHILLFLLNPALKSIAVITLINGIKNFFIRVNRKAGGNCYDEADVLYFSSIGTLFLIAIEILCHIQDVKLANMAGNIAYLLLDKVAYILIFLTIEEVIMLRSNISQITDSIDKYLITSRIEKKTMLTVWKQLTLSYVLCLSIALPYYLGLQWIKDDISLMTIFLFVLSIALIFMKIVFSDAWNLMGTILFANAVEMSIIIETPFSNKSRRSVILGLFATGALLVAFGISYPKQLFMLFMFMIISACLITFLIVVVYLISMGIGYLAITITKSDTISTTIKTALTYIGWVLTSLPKPLASSIAMVSLSFVTMTYFPKSIKCDNIFSNSSVVDTNGNWLFIDEEYDHYYAPVLYEELPEFFKKILVAQEDRGFFQQGNLLPKSPSNWHGISLSVFRGRGGSNINAQTVKNFTFIDADGFPRDLSRKLAEMVAGYVISVRETPEHIMELYVNVAAFHGTFAGFRGLNAASLYAFGKPINQLNLIQQLYLVNTLPRSIYVKGSDASIKYTDIQNDPTDIVKTALYNKAQRWFEEGLISKKELNTLKRQDLAFTNCRYKSNIPMATRIHLKNKITAPGRQQSYITLENEQAMISAYNTLRNNSAVFRKNGDELEVATIIVDVHNGHIIGHYSSGMIDYTNYRDGFDIGSLGKPFIVAQMLEMGASPDFKLFDGQINGKKTPQNATQGWSNRYVSIDEALSKSLNAPFVNISSIMKPQPVFIGTESSYRKMGIRSEPHHIEMCDDVYNYPLGLRQMHMTEVAQMYQTIINNGICCPLREFEMNQANEPIRIYESKNAAVVKQAMSKTITSGTMKDYKNKLPNGRTYYAKTGTTTQQRYGWSVLSDGHILIVSFASYGHRHGDNLKLGVQPLWGGSTAGYFSVLIYNEIKNTVM